MELCSSHRLFTTKPESELLLSISTKLWLKWEKKSIQSFTKHLLFKVFVTYIRICMCTRLDKEETRYINLPKIIKKRQSLLQAQGCSQIFMRCKAVRRCNNVQFIANSIFWLVQSNLHKIELFLSTLKVDNKCTLPDLLVFLSKRLSPAHLSINHSQRLVYNC